MRLWTRLLCVLPFLHFASEALAEKPGVKRWILAEGARGTLGPPSLAPDGKLWYAFSNRRLRVLDPQSGRDDHKVDVAAHGDDVWINDLAVDRNGRVWLTSRSDLFLYHPDEDKLERFEMPGGGLGLAISPSNELWITSEQSNLVAKIDIETAEISAIRLGSEADLTRGSATGRLRGGGRRTAGRGRSRGRSTTQGPVAIAFEGTNKLWLTLARTNFLARVDVSSQDIDRIELPLGTYPRYITLDSQGGVWLIASDGRRKKPEVLRLDPGDFEVQSWSFPGESGGRPLRRAFKDAQDRIWFTNSSELWRFDTRSKEFLQMKPLPFPGATYFDPRAEEIWVLGRGHATKVKLGE